MGAWIEIREDLITAFRGWVAPLVGAWIEIKIVKIPQTWEFVAPLVGAWIEIPLATPVDQRYLGRSPCGSVD